jgi:geranylgeranyl diphosphate synthase type II
MRRLIDRYDCCEYARQIAQGLAGAASHEFSLLTAALPNSRDKSFLEQMAIWVIERN